MNTLPVYASRYLRPRLARNVIVREDALNKLREALRYPITLVRAGAGYGKSTLINQSFPEAFCRTVWLHLSENENNPLSFLHQLVHAVHSAVPAGAAGALSLLAWDERQGNPDALQITEALMAGLRAIDATELIIILDDFQYTGSSEEVLVITEALVAWMPNHVHLVISSREKVQLPGLALRRAKGEVLDVSETDLAFSAADIGQLFSSIYELTIDNKLAVQLASRTEGWIMAIHMLAQHMKKGCSWEVALSSLPRSLSELFEFLAQDYLEKQPETIRRFLLQTAHLQLLRAEDCNHILAIDNSLAILRDLETKGLFTFHMGSGLYRYHHLFQDFLQNQGDISAEDLQQIHQRAAGWYRRRDTNLAVEHYLAGSFFTEAAVFVREIYQDKLAAGRQAELERWLERMPRELVCQTPELLLCRGEIYRLTGDFANAERLYGLAGKLFAAAANRSGEYAVAKAYALIYLDTVQPVTAERYLERTLQLVDSANIQEKARLYQLLAENKINLGRAEEAAALFIQANELFLEDSRGDVEARMHLRTGRLLTAKQILDRQTKRRTAFEIPKSHRETPLLLSLINAFMGDTDEAWLHAQEGLNTGNHLKAVFVQAVGYMRMGHAKQLKSWTDTEAAAECYHQALELVSGLAVERGKAEPLCGLCVLYGHQGNLESAVRYGLEGVAVGEKSKDDWMTAMLELALAIAYHKSAVGDKALYWAERAYKSFCNCGDSYLSMAALYRQAAIALEANDRTQFSLLADKLLFVAQTHDYDFFFYRPTLLGLRDPQAAMPLLLAAQRENIRSEYVSSLLTELGLSAELVSHPGYTLRVQALGPFIAWRGMQEVKSKEWQREKAKRLFQYFLAHRKKLVHKEQLVEAIWGEDGSDSDFKVAMNAMINALEPSRHARKAPFYVNKNESTYGLNLAAGMALDVDEFESCIARAKRIESKDTEQAIRLYRLALNLYKGDFLQECCYEDWCLEERERLLILYLTTAERMAYMLFERGESEECISLCMRILGKDRCWEGTYGLLMRCYGRQNNRSMVAKVYKQCQHNLKSELGVAPSEETMALYNKLTNHGN